jgi:hypothetical protein
MRENESSLQGNPNTRKCTESIDFSTFFEEVTRLPHGEALTYGPTPLDRVSTLGQQLDLAKELQQHTYRDIPEDVPLEIIDYVHTTFIARFHSRAEANEENYVTSLNTDAVFSPEILDMFYRAECGIATPAELIVTRELKGIRSVELACLTHPYGKRVENVLPEMRDSVKQHVEYLGGTYFEDPETRYRVKEIIGHPKGQEEFDKGMLMTRKRTIGIMPDGTVIRERSSFVVRLDENTMFNEDDIKALESVDLSQPDWHDELVKAGNLDEIVPLLLESNLFSLAIPISTTIYAYNSETAKRIKENYSVAFAQRQTLFADQNPSITEAKNNGPPSTRNPQEIYGVHYVGPSESFIEMFDKALGDTVLNTKLD